MLTFHYRQRFIRARKLLVLLVVMTLANLQIDPLFSTSYAGERENRRISVAFKLFPSFLSADRNLKQKVDAAGKLNLYILYQENQRRAEDLAKRMQERGTLRRLPIKVASISLKALAEQRDKPIGGIFIAEPLGDELLKVVSVARSQQVLLISPFKGDVDRGATGGISITDRVQPLINMQALRAAGIELKSFFLRVSKRYGR
uniref:YfiR family protein n=1 Tax=Magnetococcus massalia (strain MO-1) TaxID=451514 RepID=A0A1S7LGB1_MAGMO|nr:conserved exported protein of unknown function [Candidatus Magnetococcus massalia]